MKKILLILIISAGLVRSAAGPRLIAVKLSGPAQIAAWHRTGIPTYALAGATAIAAADDAQMAVLAQAGFSSSVIDDQAWSASYWYGRIPDGQRSGLPAAVAYQDHDLCVLRASPDRVMDLQMSGLRLARLDRKVLPERFWRQASRVIIPLNALPWDPFIQGLVDQVNADSMYATILRLQDFKTRLMLSDSCHAAQDWILQRFAAWGYPVELDSFFLDIGWPAAGWDRNVIATKPGAMLPSRIVILCGHMDCIVWPDSATARVNAPGADDNASGTAGAMEIARIFRGYSWEPTCQFIGWTSEELGLFGSYHYAAWADSQDLDIQAVLNMDMIGYMDDVNVDCNIENHGSFTVWLSNLIRQAGLVYAPAVTQYEETWPGGSDDLPFYQHGYAATCNIERWYYSNPNYHKVTDLITTINQNLYLNTTKAVLAAAAVLGTYPTAVEDVAVQDIGDGQRLQVNWGANPESDISGYRVYWGRQSGSYPESLQTPNLNDTLTGLLDDSLYYIIVRAVDAAGHVSPLAYEVTGRPRSLPLAPSGLVATPMSAGIRLDWLRNAELDLAGYRIYRRLNQDPVYDSLNITLVTDSTYTDQPLSGADKYYYALRAFDISGNASPLSTEAYGRPITMDQGVLIVDETYNWTSGNFPRDSMQDEFYRYILNGYRITEFEYGDSTQRPVLADFVPYSTVAWFGDDYTSLLASQAVPDLQRYLQNSGRLWIAGWKTSADLRNMDVYPIDFLQGSFIHYYLRLAHADLTATTDSFQAAVGMLGYPNVSVDPAKVPILSWGGTMRYIEALTGATTAENIYAMDMRNDGSPFEGSVCATRYLGTQHRVVYFGFPLYFMEREQSRLVAQKVMQDFGEQMVREAEVQLPINRMQVQPNRPNPFVKSTRIGYHLPYANRITIKIYNNAGQLLRVLIDQHQEVGSHSVIWDGNDEEGRPAASGVYFYCLSSGQEHVTGQILLTR